MSGPFILTLAVLCSVSGFAADSPPNIIVLLAEDLGYGELGCQGNHQIPTPHFDSIAIEVIGSLGDPVELEQVIKRDDWNELRVIARGFTFTHIINGRIMSVALDEDVAARKASGLITFQLQSGPPMKIRVKDLVLRELN